MRYAGLALVLLTSPIWGAELPEKKSQVPERFQFVRTVEVEGAYALAGRDEKGAQMARIETRYLDPDVNAFVGLIATFARFNERLRVGEPPELKTALFIANWGA